MSSVRSRWEREFHRQESPEAPAPARPRSPLVVASHQPTTRQSDEAAAFQAAGPEILPKLGPRAEQMTSVHSPTVTSVRSRLDQQRAVEEAKSERPTMAANAQYWLDAHEEERRQSAARDAERDREMRERVARNEAIGKSNAQALVVNLTFNQFNATPAERARILALPAAKDASPEKLVSMLLEVRELHAFAEACSADEKASRRNL